MSPGSLPEYTNFNPCPMSSEFHNLKRGHYWHNNNAFSLLLTTVKVQKKILHHVIHLSSCQYWPYPNSLISWPTGHKYYDLSRGLFRHYNLAYGFSQMYLGLEEKIFLYLIHVHFYYMTLLTSISALISNLGVWHSFFFLKHSSEKY